jgi:Protein of unknown function (DUF3224)
MGTKISAAFEVESWDEVPFDEGPGLPKLTQATVARKYSSGVDGTSTTVWLMAYAEDGSATFVGLERFQGTIDGRTGSLVLRHVGSFEGGAAKASLTVVPGSGTGELTSATGDGDFLADPKGSINLDLAFN